MVCRGLAQQQAEGRAMAAPANVTGTPGISFLGASNVPALGIGLAALGRPGYINIGHGSDLSSKVCVHWGALR